LPLQSGKALRSDWNVRKFLCIPMYRPNRFKSYCLHGRRGYVSAQV
jgi:hypothetical protein